MFLFCFCYNICGKNKAVYTSAECKWTGLNKSNSDWLESCKNMNTAFTFSRRDNATASQSSWLRLKNNSSF